MYASLDKLWHNPNVPHIQILYEHPEGDRHNSDPYEFEFSLDHPSVSKWAICPAFNQFLTQDGTSTSISQCICSSQRAFCESLFGVF